MTPQGFEPWVFASIRVRKATPYHWLVFVSFGFWVFTRGNIDLRHEADDAVA
jgi:hypothetical protein